MRRDRLQDLMKRLTDHCYLCGTRTSKTSIDTRKTQASTNVSSMRVSVCQSCACTKKKREIEEYRKFCFDRTAYGRAILCLEQALASYKFPRNEKSLLIDLLKDLKQRHPVGAHLFWGEKLTLGLVNLGSKSK